MARNGSGTYSNPYPDFVSGTVISSSEVDANNSDIATALTQSIAVDGQTTVTANLPLNSKKLTGLAVGTAAGDSVTLGQAQAEAFIWCATAGGSADAITLAPSPAITAYAAGQRFVWMASSSTNTGATTVAISGLSTIALQDNGAALVAGNHAASKMFMGILNTTSTVQIMQVQISGTDPLIVSSLTVSGTATIGGILSVDDTTTSTSGTTGSIHTDGGLGVAGTAFVAGAAKIVGVTTHGGNVVSDTDSVDDLGTTGVRWANTWTDTINGVTSPTAQYTSAEETKLAGIEASADVTDATNVASALANGVAALTSGEVTQLANIGTAAISAAEWGYVAASTQAYDSADHTKLNGIEASADVTDATNVLAGLVGQEAVATGFTGTLDGVLGGGTAAAASVTTLNLNNSLQFSGAGATSRFINDGDVNVIKMGGDHATQPIYLDMVGEDDGDNETIYGSMRTVITADADGSEAGYLQFAIMGGNTAGSLTSDVLKIGNGCVFGGPTGGLKGYGTLNCTGAYDDNSLLSCFPFDQELDGTIDNDKWDAKVPDRTTSESVDKDGNVIAASTIERDHEPMRKFKARIGTDYDPLDIDKYAAHWKAKRHLTSMPNEKKYDSVDGTLTTGEWIQRLLETVEIQAIHIEGLNQRLKALEG